MYDLFEGEVHPSVAADKVTVECLTILELDEHRVALCGIKKT